MATNLSKLIRDAMEHGTYMRPDYSEVRLTRGEAIRAFCIDCYCGENAAECPDQDCPLWSFRKGKEIT